MSIVVEIGGSRLQNFLHFQRDPLGFMLSINNAGKIVSLRSSSKAPSFALNHPEAIREVLITKEYAFRKGRSSRILKKTVGEGILTTEGKKHDRQRQALLPAFYKQRIQEYADTIIEQTTLLLDQWKVGEERWVHADFMNWTLTNIIHTMFGKHAGDTERIGNAVEETIQYSAKRIYSPIPLPKFLPTKGNLRHSRAMQILNRNAKKFIEQYDNRTSSPSLLSDLLKDEGTTDQEIIDQMITMLIAGHETTANALTWTCYLLSQHPEVEERWREEIDRKVGNRLPTYEDLSELTFSHQIWQETLRLYPPAWMILREANEEVEIQGNSFPTNSIFMICPYSLHRNNSFFEHPDQFLPDRFSSEAENRIPRYAYLPFGAGSRSCIGNQFATIEAILILVMIAQRFRLEIAHDHQFVLPEPSISLRVKGGLKMKVKAPK